MSSHKHHFNPEEWKFDCSENTPVYCTGKVAEEGFFVEEVYHDHDGDWQAFHNGGDSSSSPKLLCLGCVCEFDSTILKLHDLPVGWFAFRDEPGLAWNRKPYERQYEE